MVSGLLQLQAMAFCHIRAMQTQILLLPLLISNVNVRFTTDIEEMFLVQNYCLEHCVSHSKVYKKTKNKNTL